MRNHSALNRREKKRISMKVDLEVQDNELGKRKKTNYIR